MEIKIFCSLLIGCLVFVAKAEAAPGPVLSPSVDPARIGAQLKQPLITPKLLPLLNTDQKKSSANNPILGADKIKFFLNKLEITGNTVYSYTDLLPLFKPYLQHEVSLSDIQKITREITLKYRQAGYILSRAILPAQQIAQGKVKIQIIEGFITSVHVRDEQGNEVRYSGSSPLLRQYGRQLAQNRPLNMARLEKYALIANDTLGMEKVKTVLQAPESATTMGATDIIFIPDFIKASAFIKADNRGSKYLGQNQFVLGGTLNSVIQSGDQIGFQGLTTSRWSNLRYLNVYTLQPLGTQGSLLTLSGSSSRTQPEFLLAPLEIKGKSEEILVSLQTPLIRSRQKSLYTVVSLDYLNSKTDIGLFHLNLYDDHIRSLKLAANYYQQDAWQGLNQLGLQLSQGLPIAGYSPANQLNLSRYKGRADYTKWNFSASRLQGLTDKLSFYLSGIGQYTSQPLLSSEQFAFGGTPYGLAYDAAEITGDKGLAAKAEIRYNAAPGWRYLNNIQYFGFYDAGKVWNIESQKLNGLPELQSAVSTGVGVRINFNSYLFGTAELAKPLTHNVAVMGNRNMRIFMSLTLTGKTKLSSEDKTSPPSLGALAAENDLPSGAATNGPIANAGNTVLSD